MVNYTKIPFSVLTLVDKAFGFLSADKKDWIYCDNSFLRYRSDKQEVARLATKYMHTEI